MLELFYTEVWIAVKHFVFFVISLFREKLDINISPPICKIPVEILYPQVTLAGRMGVCANSMWEQVCPKRIQGCGVQ